MNRKTELLGDMGTRMAGMLGKAMDAYRADPVNNIGKLRTALTLTDAFLGFARNYNNQTIARRAN